MSTEPKQPGQNETTDAEKKQMNQPADKNTTASPSVADKKSQKLYCGHPIRTLAEIQDILRRRFWVSDGGFTELHAVWNHEESLLIPGNKRLVDLLHHGVRFVLV